MRVCIILTILIGCQSDPQSPPPECHVIQEDPFHLSQFLLSPDFDDCTTISVTINTKGINTIEQDSITSVNRSLSIECVGEAFTWVCPKDFFCFDVQVGASLVIHNCSFQGGVVNVTKGDKVELHNVHIFGEKHHRPLTVRGAKVLLLNNVTCLNASARSLGENVGGCLLSIDALEVTIGNSTFKNCEAEQSGGCIVIKYSSPGVQTTSYIVIENCVFENGYAWATSWDGYGGIVNIEGRSSNFGYVLIHNTTFRRGEGLYLQDGGCVFIENINFVIVTNSSFVECVSGSGGGGLHIQSTKLITINALNFSKCMSSDASAMFITSSSNVTVTNIHASECATTYDAHMYVTAIAFVDIVRSVELRNAYFNYISHTGGGVVRFGHDDAKKNSPPEVTKIEDIIVLNSEYVGTLERDHFGGGVHVLYTKPSSSSPNTNKIEITNITAENCSCAGDGGALRVQSDTPNSLVTVSNVFARNVTAFDDGGAVHIITGGYLLVKDVSVTNAKALGDGGCLSIVSQGNSSRSVVNLQNVFLSQCSSGLRGSGLFVQGNLSTITLQNVSMSNAPFNRTVNVNGSKVKTGCVHVEILNTQCTMNLLNISRWGVPRSSRKSIEYPYVRWDVDGSYALPKITTSTHTVTLLKPNTVISRDTRNIPYAAPRYIERELTTTTAGVIASSGTSSGASLILSRLSVLGNECNVYEPSAFEEWLRDVFNSDAPDRIISVVFWLCLVCGTYLVEGLVQLASILYSVETVSVASVLRGFHRSSFPSYSIRILTFSIIPLVSSSLYIGLGGPDVPHTYWWGWVILFLIPIPAVFFLEFRITRSFLAKYMPYLLPNTKLWFLTDGGIWRDECPEERFFVVKYGCLFQWYVPNRTWYGVNVEGTATLLVGVVGGIPVTTESGCIIQYVVKAAIMAAQSIAILHLRPHHNIFNWVMECIASVASVLAISSRIANRLVEDEPNNALDHTEGIFVAIAVGAIVFEFVVFYVVWFLYSPRLRDGGNDGDDLELSLSLRGEKLDSPGKAGRQGFEIKCSSTDMLPDMEPRKGDLML
eukprot:PhF_6_TR36486/c0_g1_i5/m.53610